MRWLPLHKSKLTLSYWLQLCKQLEDSTDTLYIYINARRVIHGSAARLTAKMSTLTRDCSARITAASRRSNGAWSLGGEVTDNATVHLFYRDDRKPAGPQSVSRLAV